MGELGARWILAGLAVCLAGWLGQPSFPFLVSVAIGWGVASWIALRRNRRNPGVAGLIAGLDAFALSLFLSGVSRLGAFGWVSVIPLGIAVVHHSSRALNTAAVVAGAMLAAHVLVQGTAPSSAVTIEAGAMLVLGLALYRPSKTPVSDAVGNTDPLSSVEPDTFLGLRESFRQLKTLYRNLEWKSRRDRIVATLLQVRLGDDASSFGRLASQARELTGAQTAQIFPICHHPRGFACSEGFLRIDADDALATIRQKADDLMATIGNPKANVPLMCDGAVVGLCTLTAPREKIDEVRAAALELAPFLATMIRDIEQRMVARQSDSIDKLRLACLVHARGASSPQDAIERIGATLLETFDLHHLSIRHDGSVLFQAGRSAPPEAWVSDRFELIAPDAQHHPGIPSVDVARLRIGSIGSIWVGRVQVVATASEGIVDHRFGDQVRSIAADIDWLLDPSTIGTGRVSAEVFKKRLSEPGVLVLFEQTDRETRSRNDVATSSKSMSSRALDFLPSRGSIFVRDDGDILVHLPGVRLAEATNWAERAAAGHTALRARTASLWPPTNAIVLAQLGEPEGLFAQSKL